jgi:hypothetical protein
MGSSSRARQPRDAQSTRSAEVAQMPWHATPSASSADAATTTDFCTTPASGAGAHAAKLAKTTAHRSAIGFSPPNTQRTVLLEGSERQIVAMSVLFGNLGGLTVGNIPAC